MKSSRAVKSKPAINSVTQACVSGLASPMLAITAEVYRMEAFSGSRQVIAPISSGPATASALKTFNSRRDSKASSSIASRIHDCSEDDRVSYTSCHVEFSSKSRSSPPDESEELRRRLGRGCRLRCRSRRGRLSWCRNRRRGGNGCGRWRWSRYRCRRRCGHGRRSHGGDRRRRYSDRCRRRGFYCRSSRRRLVAPAPTSPRQRNRCAQEQRRQ